MILQMIQYQQGKTEEKTIFMKALTETLAKMPKYWFYNGGCGVAALCACEASFLKSIGQEKSIQANLWNQWHQLAKEKRKDEFERLIKLSEAKAKAKDYKSTRRELGSLGDRHNLGGVAEGKYFD